MIEVTTGSRGYKQAREQADNSCYIMFIVVLCIFVFIEFLFLNLCIYFYEFM